MNEKKQQDENQDGWTTDLTPPPTITTADAPPRQRPSSSLLHGYDTDDVKAEEARLERAYSQGADSSRPPPSFKTPKS